MRKDMPVRKKFWGHSWLAFEERIWKNESRCLKQLKDNGPLCS